MTETLPSFDPHPHPRKPDKTIEQCIWAYLMALFAVTMVTTRVFSHYY